MDDDARRGSPLLAYAALVCGGVVACLLLLAGPAQADSADPDGGRDGSVLPLDQVGERVAATTRDVGRGASEAVRGATAPAAGLAPVGEAAAEQVATTTGRLADGVAQATHDADEVVDEPTVPLPETPATPGTPVTEEQDDGGHRPAASRPDRLRDRVDRPLRTRAVRDDVRAAPERSRAPHGVRASRTTRVAGPAPAPVPVITSPSAGAHAPAAVPVPAPYQLVAGCDDCAATGSSSGGPLLVLGLPTQGVTAPRFADSVPHDAVVGGPATVFRRPDVSPD